jgi:hypothetical protein
MIKRTLVLGLALLASTGYAEWRLPVPALDDRELDQLRGGFVMDNIEISIGLEQVLSVNGETLVVNRLVIPDLNQSMSADTLTHQLETVQGNWTAADGQLTVGHLVADSGGWMSVIQNSLNGTTIQNVRQLNIELNNLGGAYRLPRDFDLPMLTR